jgi:hypothetical protein
MAGHARQSSDKRMDRTMRVACYVICTLSVAICLGLFVYEMLP